METISFLKELSVFETITAIVFFIAAITQLMYYFIIFIRLANYKPQSQPAPNEPVSVIICAHDEDYNLEDNLPSILNQNYPDYEVVVVNHASTDNTSSLLEDFQRNFSNLKIVNIEQDLNFFKGKKFPLSIGIKSAKNDLLLLTDADCQPVSENWIKTMVESYHDGTEVVLGYGPYKKTSGLLNFLIRYDTFMIALQYFSYALAGMPYMGVGRNLSYRKSLFMKNKGFTSHYNISSGDDDLFIMQIANKRNTRISIDKDSFMVSDPKTSFRNWYFQKKRHLTTGKEYQFRFKLLLSFFSVTHLLFYISLITLLVTATLLIPTIILGVLAIAVRVLIQKKAAQKLGVDQLLLFSLFGDILYIIINSTISITSVFRKQGDWK